MFKSGAAIITLMVLLSWGVVARAEIAAPSASAVIEDFHAVLLDVMKNAESLGVKQRYRHLEAPIKESFNLALMIRVASGAFWRKADRGQKEGLVAAFTRASVGTYAFRFDGYSGQEFRILGESRGANGAVLVRTNIISPDSEPVDLTYVMKSRHGDWRIVDVLVGGGISELAVRRSENLSTLKTGGVDALIAALNRKADGLLAE